MKLSQALPTALLGLLVVLLVLLRMQFLARLRSVSSTTTSLAALWEALFQPLFRKPKLAAWLVPSSAMELPDLVIPSTLFQALPTALLELLVMLLVLQGTLLAMLNHAIYFMFHLFSPHVDHPSGFFMYHTSWRPLIPYDFKWIMRNNLSTNSCFILCLISSPVLKTKNALYLALVTPLPGSRHPPVAVDPFY